ncbi:MAG: hypothetical protein NVSMB23_15390 [Myxococcales bacterium]
MGTRLSRRGFLVAGVSGAAAALLPGRARAFGERSRLSFALLRHGGRWDPRPDALPRLAWEVAKRTSIDTTPAVARLGPADPELFRHPFAVLASDQAVPALGEAEVAALRRYLSYGGLLLLDDATGARNSACAASFREILGRVLPGARFATVRRDHVVYKSFYLLDGPAGRVAATPDLEAIELGGRLAVVASGNDLLGALARDSFGAWEMEVTPGGETQREKAIRLGVNLAMYAMCLDYKEDQVHIPFILKRRRI